MKVPIGIQKAIDETFRLRKEIAMLKAQEAGLSETIKNYMEKSGLHVIETDKVSAEYAERPQMTVNPDKLYDALETDWMKFISCVSARLEPNQGKQLRGVRDYLGEEDIKKISKITNVQVLSLKAVAAAEVVETAPAKRGRPAKAAQ